MTKKQGTRLICLNIEGRRHLSCRVLPFLTKEEPDIICIQEVFLSDLQRFSALGYQSFFRPNCLKPGEEGLEAFGIATFSRTAFTKKEECYYRGSGTTLLPFEKVRHLDTFAYVCIKVDVPGTDGKILTIGNTHFTWAPNGTSTEHQLQDADKLLKWLGDEELILCGDFNSPRANKVRKGETHARFARRYKDNIPHKVKTTIDPELHRVPGLEYVVDHLWTTPGYRAENVRVVNGVSDHCAIVAEIL